MMTKQLAAIAVILTLCAGHLAVCEGWQASADARMSCCTSDACPMHQSEPTSGARVVDHTQADSCCALSESHDAPATPSAFTLSHAVVLAPTSTPIDELTAVYDVEAWRVFIPPPTSPVPKHLLLSVFLV